MWRVSGKRVELNAERKSSPSFVECGGCVDTQWIVHITSFKVSDALLPRSQRALMGANKARKKRIVDVDDVVRKDTTREMHFRR